MVGPVHLQLPRQWHWQFTNNTKYATNRLNVQNYPSKLENEAKM